MESLLINTEDLMPIIINYGHKILMALITLLVGSWVVNKTINIFKKLLEKQNVDASLSPFLSSLVGSLLKIMLYITVIGMMGIEMTSFIAILGAESLAVGMALSGTLQNFAGGIMILLFKPFKVGDVVDAQGYIGSVKEIQIFNTFMKTPDNKTIIIPNGGLSTGSMINYSTELTKRVDWTVGIGYGDDIDKAKEVILGLLKKDDRILDDPAPFTAVSELADSSVNLTVRAWANATDYWGIFFGFNERVYKAFGKEGLNIPFPQMDVHVHKD
jgi:small conductance mechanosensitive channel